MSRARRAAAIGHLAGLYARHMARRVVRRHDARSGLALFLATYRPERLTEVTPAERGNLPGHGLCIACGVCGFATPRHGSLTPERLPLQLTRSLPDWWVARDSALADVDWQTAASVCPMGVPLAAIAGDVAARLKRDGMEPPPPQLPPMLGEQPGWARYTRSP